MAAASNSSPTAGDLGAVTPDLDPGFGLAGTVDLYQRHVFLCYKGPDEWSSSVDDGSLPSQLNNTIKIREHDLKKITKFTICQGDGVPKLSNGDVLIFPDMICYKGLTHLDVEEFVEKVLVKDDEFLGRPSQAMTGSYVFVCCHGGKDTTCRICGPHLMLSLYDEMEAYNLDHVAVTISACSHVSRNNKHAGNIIIFGSDTGGEVGGHWYGNVLPCDVPTLMLKHIIKGEIVDFIWRGQMGLTQEQQREKALKLRNMPNAKKSSTGSKELKSICPTTPSQTREMAHTYAALAVIAAAVSVFAAFRIFKHLS